MADTTENEELLEENAPSSYTTETQSEPTGSGQSVTAPGIGLGRRKRAVARVRLIPGSGEWKINGRTLESYFPNKLHQQLVRSPFTLLDLEGRFDVVARVSGGGTSGQAGAVRLGLARAFLHDAPFLLLDEPTSNLDSLNEAMILRSLKETAGDKTVLIVSHRPSSLTVADRIIGLETDRRS